MDPERDSRALLTEVIKLAMSMGDDVGDELFRNMLAASIAYMVHKFGPDGTRFRVLGILDFSTVDQWKSPN